MRRPALPRGIPVVGPLMLVLALAACSSGNDAIGPIGSLAPSAAVPYQHANAFSPVGYKESLIAENHYRVEVTGHPNTPPSQLEKIAATRAAEIGRDNRLRYFKVGNLQHSTRCTPARSTYRGGGYSERNYRVLTADVTYAKAPPDPTYLESRPTFDQLRAELDQPQTPATPADSTPFECQS
jgi:hypothetical protein